MQKTILITGSTDGIGLETARVLVSQGHKVLIHGRNPAKLKAAEKILAEVGKAENIESYVADLSNLVEVDTLAKAIAEKHTKLDVLINNAGVFKTPNPITKNGMDVRFIVNTIAPYSLTQKLLPLMGASGRVINLSSAAQSPVDVSTLAGKQKLSDDFSAYAQSKLALTMWSRNLAQLHKEKGLVIIAVNPGSLLATKMVKEGFNTPGNDISIGSDILVRAALSDEFSSATGLYYDNDSKQFSSPHPDATDLQKIDEVVRTIDEILGGKVV